MTTVAVYAVLLVLTVVAFASVPTGFIPTQDKQYLVAVAQLPTGRRSIGRIP